MIVTLDKVVIKGLAPMVPQLTTVGERTRALRILFVATDSAGGVIMVATVGRGAANNLIAAGFAEEII